MTLATISLLRFKAIRYTMDALARWERYVKAHPFRARMSGPPNQVVLERQRPGENFLAAARRVRTELGLGSVTKTPKNVTKNVTPVTKNVTQRPKSNAERQKAYRGRKHE